jgi:hypothetical protein
VPPADTVGRSLPRGSPAYVGCPGSFEGTRSSADRIGPSPSSERRPFGPIARGPKGVRRFKQTSHVHPIDSRPPLYRIARSAGTHSWDIRLGGFECPSIAANHRSTRRETAGAPFAIVSDRRRAPPQHSRRPSNSCKVWRASDRRNGRRSSSMLGVAPSRFPWWARQVLNLRPLACEASALPLSYAPASDLRTRPTPRDTTGGLRCSSTKLVRPPAQTAEGDGLRERRQADPPFLEPPLRVALRHDEHDLDLACLRLGLLQDARHIRRVA